MEKVKNTITKASLKNDRCEATYKELFEEANYTNEVNKKCDQITHPDLTQAFSFLRPFLITITEQPEAGLFHSGNIDEPTSASIEEEISKYFVTGYTCGGSDENAGVSISGQKMLKSGKVLNLSAPFIKFEEDGTDAYKFSTELRQAIDRCNWEVSEYLFSGKYGFKQQQLDFEFDAPTEAVLEEQPKNRRGRKAKEPEAFGATA